MYSVRGPLRPRQKRVTGDVLLTYLVQATPIGWKTWGCFPA
jgi:hypothetical protein